MDTREKREQRRQLVSGVVAMSRTFDGPTTAHPWPFTMARIIGKLMCVVCGRDVRPSGRLRADSTELEIVRFAPLVNVVCPSPSSSRFDTTIRYFVGEDEDDFTHGILYRVVFESVDAMYSLLQLNRQASERMKELLQVVQNLISTITKIMLFAIEENTSDNLNARYFSSLAL